MSITVATVVMNAAEALPLTLESALLQDHDDLEVIVVDGASTDRTHEVLALYQGVVDRIEVVEDCGVFDAMNRAAAIASKDTILFMNAGDRFYSERSLSALWRRRRPETDVAYGRHVYRAAGVDVLKGARAMAEHVAALRTGLVSWDWLAGFPVHQATLTRTDLLRRLRYDTSFRLAADHDFLMRAYDDGAVLQYVDEIVCVYHGGGLTDRRRDDTSRELNAIYRARSERPDKVDELFFADDSPFAGMSSPLAGDVLAGLIPYDEALRGTLPLPGAFRWAGGRGFRLVSPAHRSVEGLTLTGWNELPRQVVEIFAGGERVLREVLDAGPFELSATFATHLPPGSVVDVATQLAVRAPGRAELVSLAVKGFSFHFVEPVPPLATGVPFETTSTGGRAVAMALSGGWWAPEKTHVWSKAAGELRLGSADRVRSVAVSAFANPVVAGQRLALSVNGIACGEAALERHPTTLTFDVAPAWLGAGAENRLLLVPSEAARVGGDPRELGFALAAVTLA